MIEIKVGTPLFAVPKKGINKNNEPFLRVDYRNEKGTDIVYIWATNPLDVDTDKPLFVDEIVSFRKSIHHHKEKWYTDIELNCRLTNQIPKEYIKENSSDESKQ